MKNGRTSTEKPTTTFPWWSQTCKQPITRSKLWTTECKHKLWATTSDVWKQNYQTGFNHSRDLQSSTDVSPADPPAIPLSAYPPAKNCSNKAGGTHNLDTHFPKDPNTEVCRRTKGTREPCKINPDDRADRIKFAERFWGYDNSRPQGS